MREMKKNNIYMLFNECSRDIFMSIGTKTLTLIDINCICIGKVSLPFFISFFFLFKSVYCEDKLELVMSYKSSWSVMKRFCSHFIAFKSKKNIMQTEETVSFNFYHYTVMKIMFICRERILGSGTQFFSFVKFDILYILKYI